MVGVVIDDLIVLEKIASEVLGSLPADAVPPPAQLALDAYAANGLEANLKKSFFSQECSRFWESSWTENGGYFVRVLSGSGRWLQ